METSLLTTKLNIPPARPQIISRPGLIEQLQDGLNYHLILVSAPAGFGKTTFLSEWVHQNQQQISTAWLSLDEGDNDPVRFWDYFIASIRTFKTDFAEIIIPWLHSSQPPSTESLVVALINELVKITGDFVIVLDDYHLIESQQIHDGISYLLDHIPEKMHLTLSSRADPPLPLSRYRAKRTMLEIGADNLRFNPEDVAELFKQLEIPTLSLEDITALNMRAEGWVTGLIMAALSMREQKDIPGFIVAFTGSQRYVMDYLLDEVLQKQTAELREFLLKTSVLERLNSSLCDALTGKKDSRNLLINLERDRLFIVPLDETRQWYRYEHLFADLLRHQCEMTYGKEQIVSLLQKASQWYEDNNLPDDAIHYALKGEDWENATRLITRQSRNKQKSGEYVTLIEWIQALPEHVLQGNRLLCLPYYLALIHTGKFETLEAKLEMLEEMAEHDENVKGEVIAIQAFIASRRLEKSLGVELAQKALTLLPPDSLYLRANMFLILGVTDYESGLKESEKMLKKSHKLALQAGEDYIAFYTLTLLGIIQIRMGKLHRAVEYYQQAVDQVEPSPAATPPHMILSSTLLEYNDLEGAEYHAQRVIELSQLMGYLVRSAAAYLILADIRLIQGDMSGALKAVERAESEAQKITTSYEIMQYTAWRIRFAILQGDMITASELGSKLPKNIDDLPWMVTDIPARLLIAQGKKEEAAVQLQNAYEKAAKLEDWYSTVRIRVFQSLAAENEEEAVEYLSDALTIAEPGGGIRTFVNEGRLVKPLLEKALSKGITPEYTHKLITIIEAEERQKLKRKRAEGVPSKYDSILSERELEVLKLMAEGLSNQQIADRLIISLGTVKNHVHNIIEKLEAKGRTQAVTQARELELI